MPTLFQRQNSSNYYVRFHPKESAQAAFEGRSDVWRSTGTSDKREAERIARRILVELEELESYYLDTFLPWAGNQLMALSGNEADQFALHLHTGHAWKEYTKEAEAKAMRFRAAGLPVPSVLDLMASGGAVAAPVSVPKAAAVTITPKQEKPVGVPREVIPRIFEIAAQVRKASTDTERMRAREGERLMDWMTKHKHTVLTTDLAHEYLGYLRKGGAPATVKQRLSLTAYAFEVAVSQGRSHGLTVELDPFNGVKLIGAVREDAEGTREPFTGEECRKILTALPSATEDPALHWCVRLAAVTGMRVAAVAGLRRDEVKQEDGLVCLLVAAREGNKTDVPYWVPVHESVAGEFWSWYTAQPAMRGGGLFKGISMVSPKFSKLLIALGIKESMEDDSKTFHCFRHSTATWLKELGLPVSHQNAMQGRKEGGTLGQYGSLASVQAWGHTITKAPLWYAEDYMQALRERLSGS